MSYTSCNCFFSRLEIVESVESLEVESRISSLDRRVKSAFSGAVKEGRVVVGALLEGFGRVGVRIGGHGGALLLGGRGGGGGRARPGGGSGGRSQVEHLRGKDHELH